MPPWGSAGADPFGAVLRLQQNPRPLATAAALALLIYGSAVAFTLAAPVAASPVPPPRQVQVPVLIATPAPIVPPAVAAPARPAPASPAVHARHAPLRPAPLAEAAQVVTRAAAADAPADFSDFVLATGRAEAYAGGFTAASGTSHSPGSSPAARSAGPASNSGPVSQARAAAPARRDWTCGWPPSAQESDLRETRAVVEVEVSADGEPLTAELRGPALPGFGEAARSCALGERFRPALDAQGRRVAGRTAPLVVHFVR